jgi:hypothetical protein
MIIPFGFSPSRPVTAGVVFDESPEEAVWVVSITEGEAPPLVVVDEDPEVEFVD